MRSRKIMIHVGDVVTCTNGHEVADIARSLKHKDIIEPSHFMNWRAPYQPLRHLDIFPSQCAQCEGRWVSGDGQFFIRGRGWRG